MIEKGVTLDVKGLKIVGRLYLPGTRKLHPAVCLCHGIPSPQSPDPSDGGYPQLAHTLCQRGFASFIFNFRGTGDSQGNLDMKGWTEDLRAAIDYLGSVPQVDKTRLAVMGFSAGAAAAVYVAAQETRLSCVVLCACPARFRLVSDPEEASLFLHQCLKQGTIRDPAFPASLKDWIGGFRQVSPIDWIDRLAPRPVLILHGDKDELIPVSQARELYQKAGNPKELIILEGGSHHLRRDERAVKLALDWLKRHL